MNSNTVAAPAYRSIDQFTGRKAKQTSEPVAGADPVGPGEEAGPDHLNTNE